MGSTMETIAQSLTPKQKARLHDVADLMLQVYRTLERMRYLEPEWIQPGPHDLAKHIPLYQSLHLDPAIIYLYHILPYLDPVMRRKLDFYNGGYFIDFRVKWDVEDGRNPTFGHTPAETLRSWMTPLCFSCNHSHVLVYDAKRHVIGIVDPVDPVWSGDRNLREGVSKVMGQDGTVRYLKSRDGEEEECGAEEWERQENQAPEEDGEEEEEEEDGEEEEEKNDWDTMDARPAPKVLRDIIRWYHELSELPGQGGNDFREWDEDLVTPLYHKHSWPGKDFDGDAFLVDKMRFEAARTAQIHAERPFRLLETLKRGVEQRERDDPSAMAKLQENVAAASTLDEEWLARWELWHAEQTTQRMKKRLKKVEQCIGTHERMRPEDLPLWELKQVHLTLLFDKRKREERAREAPRAGGPGQPSDAEIQEDIRSTEQRIAVGERAYVASLADAQRLCPGRDPLQFVGGESNASWDLGSRVRLLMQSIEDYEQQVEDVRRWMTLLPDGAVEAGKLAQKSIDSTLEFQKLAKRLRRN